jgi:RNA polymerase sigma factor for flagellar operon FliA
MHIEKLTSKLCQELGRDPIVIEICEKAKITEDEYHKLMGIAQLSYTLSLDDKVEGKEEEEALTRIESIKDESIKTPEDLIMKESLKNDVMATIKTLPDRERLALVLYYYEELTLQEIANVIGVSESRVSQILNKTLMKIRVSIVEEN